MKSAYIAALAVLLAAGAAHATCNDKGSTDATDVVLSAADPVVQAGLPRVQVGPRACDIPFAGRG